MVTKLISDNKDTQVALYWVPVSAHRSKPACVSVCMCAAERLCAFLPQFAGQALPRPEGVDLKTENPPIAVLRGGGS